MDSPSPLSMILYGVHSLPEDFKEPLADALSWEAACWLLNGLTIDLEDWVRFYNVPIEGIT